MDDDESEQWWRVHRPFETSSAALKGQGKGRHRFPTSGLCWAWQLQSGKYTGFSLTDLSAGQTLCSVRFQHSITPASKVSGRRAFTVLPPEDRALLKEELVAGRLPLEVVDGGGLFDECVLLSSRLSDIEDSLQITCPWEMESAHRIELLHGSKLVDLARVDGVPRRQRAGGSSSAVVAPHAVKPAVEDPEEKSSMIDGLVQSIRRVLLQLNQKAALEKLDALALALKDSWA